MRVELWYFESCPSWEVADHRLRDVAADLNLEIEHHVVSTAEEAGFHRFPGSPTIRVDGVDLFPSTDVSYGMSCRLYLTPDGPAGSPTTQQIRDEIDARPSG